MADIPDGLVNANGEDTSSSLPEQTRHHRTSPLTEHTLDSEGWRDGPATYSDEWYLDERPPHHRD